MVLIRRVDSDDEVGFSSLVHTNGGHFKVFNLPPGRYRLTAAGNPEANRYTASTVVDLGSEDIGGISLLLGSGAEISGRVVFDGDISLLHGNKVEISLISGDRARLPIRVRSDLTFTISEVKEGPYRFTANMPPESDSYLKSIRAQGQELVDESFEVRNNQGLAGVEVLISTQGGQISGVVKQSDRSDFAKGATVVLFSTDTARRGAKRFTKTSRTDQQGSFFLRGIVPGEYVICALLDREPGSETDPAYLGEIEKNAKRVVFKDDSTLNESITVSSAPALE